MTSFHGNTKEDAVPKDAESVEQNFESNIIRQELQQDIIQKNFTEGEGVKLESFVDNPVIEGSDNKSSIYEDDTDADNLVEDFFDDTTQDEASTEVTLETNTENDTKEDQKVETVEEKDKPVAVVKHRDDDPARHKKFHLQESDFVNYSNFKDFLQTVFSREKPGVWQCNICDKTTKNKGHAEDHAESHIEGLKYPCKHCKQDFNSRGSLRKHLISHRNQN